MRPANIDDNIEISIRKLIKTIILKLLIQGEATAI